MSSGPINSTLSGSTLTLQNSKTSSAKSDSSTKPTETKETTKQDIVSMEQIQGSSTALNNILDGISQSLQTLESTQGAVSDIVSLLNAGYQIAASASEYISPPDVAALSSLSGKYRAMLTQVNAKVEDASYKGTNLLQGADLQTSFGQNARNNITTEGVYADTDSLGLTETNFSSAESISNTLEQLQEAISTLQAYNKELTEDYNQIKTRQDFAQESLETIGGVDNEIETDEGANLLALKIGQQLAQLSESTLASRDQQDLLRLF